MAGMVTIAMMTVLLASQQPAGSEPASALARAETQWQATGPKSYRFTILLSCFCSPRGMSFRVVDGQTQVPPAADLATQRFHETYGSVERIFAVIRRAIADDSYRVNVKYHPVFGYPIWADLDRRRNVADDELFVRISGFREGTSTFSQLVAACPAGAGDRLRSPRQCATPSQQFTRTRWFRRQRPSAD